MGKAGNVPAHTEIDAKELHAITEIHIAKQGKEPTPAVKEQTADPTADVQEQTAVAFATFSAAAGTDNEMNPLSNL